MSDSTDRQLAVVTGASSGIGLELAKQLAERGFDLVPCAEDAELDAAATELRGLGAHVRSVRADLATDEGVHELVTAVKALGRPVEVLALNAGRGAGGAFVSHDGTRETKLEDELEIIDLNCRSTVHLAKHLLPGMVSEGRGRVLVTSSVASTMPGSYQAVYNASKSFTQSFALAIREELADSGVTVTTLMPGPTETEFFERADMDQDTKVGTSDKDDPAQVAAQALEGLMAGDERVEAGGLMSKVQGRFSRVLPDALKAKGHAGMAKPGTGTDGD